LFKGIDMTRIIRSNQKVFADNVAEPNNIAVFGSLESGTPAFSKDPGDIQSLAAFMHGWAAAVVNNNSPAMQDRNALDYLFSRQIAYVLQLGIPEWNAQTTYYINSYCQLDGVIYISKANSNHTHPATDISFWLPVLTPNTSGGAIGNVPLGSAIPIVNQQAWALPVPGEIKDGYALCNGQSFIGLGVGAYHPSFTAYLPDLSDDRFLMGATAIGAINGSNSITLASNNLPLSSGTYTPKGVNTGSAISGTVNIAHTHGTSAVSGSIDIAHTHSSSTISGIAEVNGSHTHFVFDGVSPEIFVLNNTAPTTGGAGKSIGTSGSAISTGAPVGQHTHTLSASAEGQTLGITSKSLTSGIANGQTLGATSAAIAGSAASPDFFGTEATITVGNTTPDSFESRPLYFSCVYVMRVK
jgi:hypothetical protein